MLTILFVTQLFLLGLLLLAVKKNRSRARKDKKELFQALGKLELRMAEGLHHVKRDNGITWLIICTYNRKARIQKLLQQLNNLEPELRILVIDNGSADGTQAFLTEALTQGLIQRVLLNSHNITPQWQKSFALTQAMKLLEAEDFQYLAWMDDDLHIGKSFSKDCQNILKSFEKEKVRFVNFIDDEIQDHSHPTEAVFELPGISKIKIKSSLSGAAVFFERSILNEIGTPPTKEGISDFSVEDWYYSRLIKALDYRVAFIDCALHEAYDDSQRVRQLTSE